MTVLNQVFFDESNLNFFFLSPYVDIATLEDEILLRRFESEMMVCIPAKDVSGKDAMKFLYLLRTGLDEKEVRDGLYNIVGDDASDFLDACMLSGIIE